MLGGDPSHWQTNVFVPAPRDKQPLYGVFGSIEDIPGTKPSIQDFHQYAIDWDAKRIEWSIDGKMVRTLKNGTRKSVLQNSDNADRVFGQRTP